MKVVHADMWTLPGFHVVTTNSSIAYPCRLVMGRGAALEAKKRYPGVDYAAAKLFDALTFYGFLTVPGYDLGLFQVKYNWRDDARIDIIARSTEMLCLFAENYTGHYNIVMNYPGIGNGNLIRADIEPIVKILPDNVTLCIKD